MGLLEDGESGEAAREFVENLKKSELHQLVICMASTETGARVVGAGASRGGLRGYEGRSVLLTRSCFVCATGPSKLPRVLLSHIPLFRPEGTSCGSTRESARTLHQGKQHSPPPTPVW